MQAFMRRRLALALSLVLLALSVARADDRPGIFGFTFSVETEGFFLSPTLKTITVTGVTPGLPAAMAGIGVGDQIVQVEGLAVAGTKAKDLEPHLKKFVGQTKSFHLRRPSGDTYSVKLVAVPGG